METAIRLIETGEAQCVLMRDGVIFAQVSGMGISPLLRMFTERGEEMRGCLLVDKVIGRAAASIAICAQVRHVHGLLMSEDAVTFLEDNGITTSHTTLVPRILNRNRDALCPMEQAVQGINDAEQALIALRARIVALRNRK